MDFYQTAVEKALLNACSQLGDNQFGKICNTLVLVYGNELINALINYETPARVCSEQLPLCPKNNTAVAPKVVAPVTAKAGSAECEICKFAIKEIESYVDSNKTQQEIQKELSLVCSKVPSIFTQTCLSVVNMIPYVLKKLEDHNSPDQICGGLHFCPAAAAQVVFQQSAAAQAELKSLIPCPACMMAMELVQQEISQQSVQTFVEDKLNKVCAKLPSTYSGVCSQLVQQYFPLLVQKLLLAVSPSKICKLIDACPASSARAIKALKAQINVVQLN